MARHLSRLLPLVRWQYLRWGLVIPALPLALWACNSHPLKQPLPNPQMETDFQILVSPEREVDILFMVDNSPSMDPKQQRLAENFPNMIQVLQQIPDPSGGTSLPDVHIGVISSDMGAGSDRIGQNCQRILGDRGLLYGNDPLNPLASVAPNADPNSGGHPQPNGCGLHSGQRWISDVANPNGTGRIQNYDGNIQDVFACLAESVGTNGCGFEHHLQSLRVALNPDYPDNPNDKDPNHANNINPENQGFVRPKAYLAVILIADEDDCSADPDDNVNDRMFLENPLTETASLRCATRGHVCSGQPIPGYDDPVAGYQPPNPLPQPNVGFSTAFSNCAPKDQVDPSNPDHHYLPLIRVQEMIDNVNGVSAWVVDKAGNYVYDANGNHVSVQKTPDRILVSGIIGWPLDPNAISSVQYQVGIDGTSMPPSQKTLWDYMPICSVPTITSLDGNIYKVYGGLRLKKFLDAFQKTDTANRPIQNTFSLCTADFKPAMQQIANAIVQVLKPGCVQYPLIDTQPNPSSGGPLQPECQVMDKISCDNPGQGKCLASGYEENPLPECIDPTTGSPFDPAAVNPNNANLLNRVPNDDTHRPCWFLYYDRTTAGCPDAYKGQRITALRKTGETAPAGTLLAMKCLTCARADTLCPPLHQ